MIDEHLSFISLILLSSLSLYLYVQCTNINIESDLQFHLKNVNHSRNLWLDQDLLAKTIEYSQTYRTRSPWHDKRETSSKNFQIFLLRYISNQDPLYTLESRSQILSRHYHRCIYSLFLLVRDTVIFQTYGLHNYSYH